MVRNQVLTSLRVCVAGGPSAGGKDSTTATESRQHNT